jgi:hypothetical protein
MSIRTMAMHGVTRQSLLHGAWPWIRMCVQTTTVVLLAVVMEAPDFGRYATALALASCVAPLWWRGRRSSTLDSHAAFGSTREQIATVWTRALFVLGVGAAIGVAAGMALFAGAWERFGLWCLVGISEIVLLGFVELRRAPAPGGGGVQRDGCLAGGATCIAVGAGCACSWLPTAPCRWPRGCGWPSVPRLSSALGAGNVKRQDAPRGLDSLMRLVRVGSATEATGSTSMRSPTATRSSSRASCRPWPAVRCSSRSA